MATVRIDNHAASFAVTQLLLNRGHRRIGVIAGPSRHSDSQARMFFTTKDINKGTGLGLSQVYGFAKQSGGDIAVASNIGTGTCFSLYLPRMGDGAEQSIANRSTSNSLPVLVDRRVLLVEDNETVGRFATSALAELGQHVVWAPNAAGALERLERGEAFDLVFSDIVMPGMSGIELAHLIRLRWPSLRVVLTSGYSHVLSEPGDHPFELIQKPYSMEDLASLLSTSAEKLSDLS